jgi:[lysine-biosynthesis-protein LysW]--L-2-aminoadipate ligase
MLAILHSRIRVEERLLADELASRGVALELIDVREHVFDIHDPSPWTRFDAVLDRCISQTHALAVVRVLESFAVPCLNTAAVIDACSDKLTTSLALARAGVPTPRVRVAFEAEPALRAVEQNGYPCVLKPTVGSWGRLLARVNDRDAAEAVIEHKQTLGGPQHGVFYVQEHVDKPGRDLRVFMVDGEPICAISRASEHWITNTARGGRAANHPVSQSLATICISASKAIGGGVLAIDLLETNGGQLLVSEINHTMEFRNSIEPTGVNIPARIIDALIRRARQAATPQATITTRPTLTSTNTIGGSR